MTVSLFYNLYLMTFDLVLSKPGGKQNYTAVEVDRHAPLIAYSSRVFHKHSVPHEQNSDFRHLPTVFLFIFINLLEPYVPKLQLLSF